LSVSINDPYAGGFITTHYGKELACTGRIAVQIEINQDLYLDPGTGQLAEEKVKSIRTKVFSSFEKITRELPPH